MRKTYAAMKLLEHGALSMRELRVITGWNEKQCRNTIRKLQWNGRVKTKERGVYSL